jgi:hypothetical protein
MSDDLKRAATNLRSEGWDDEAAAVDAAADRIEELEAALSHYTCGCKEDKCTPEKPRYRDLKCGWPARQALEGKID